MNSYRDDHQWARSRLAPWRLGLLDSTDEGRLRGHLEACPDCARALRAQDAASRQEKAWEDHLPVRMLVQWPTAAAGLVGLERELVEEHLERCEHCRADLALLGYEPSIESGAGAVTPLARVRRRTAARSVWRDRLLAGWAGLASAAVLILMIRPSAQNDTVSGPGPSVSFESTRSAGGTVVAVGPAAPWIAVTIPTGVPPESGSLRVHALLDEETLLAEEYRPEDLGASFVVLLRPPSGGWRSGICAIRLDSPAGTMTPRESRFRIRVEPSAPPRRGSG